MLSVGMDTHKREHYVEIQNEKEVTERMKRHISVKEDRRVFLYIYEDVKLKGEEESNLIILIGSRRIRKYDETRLGRYRYSPAWTWMVISFTVCINSVRR
ncbi:MAG: hypothetical protein QXP36_04325 [Conexivisphaerales archaeon]